MAGEGGTRMASCFRLGGLGDGLLKASISKLNPDPILCYRKTLEQVGRSPKNKGNPQNKNPHGSMLVYTQKG